MEIALILSIISGVASLLAIATAICTIISFKRARKKEIEEEAKWHQRIEDVLVQNTDNIKTLSKRVDSHNHYAELFGEYGEDIAYIRGTMDAYFKTKG